MRWPLFMLLLMVPAVAAGGVHGPQASATTMYIHLTHAGIVLHPDLPAPAVLEGPPVTFACGEPAVWTARFSRSIIDTDADALARPAEFDTTAPYLRWFMETVGPDGGPLPRLVPFSVSAQIISGDGAGTVMAQGTSQDIETVTGSERTVALASFALPWVDLDQTTLPAEQLTLRVTASIDDPASCGAAPIGLRAYADAEHHSRISWNLFEPVRLDLFEVGWADETLVIRVHASSPWGAFDLADPMAPMMTAPHGDAPAPVLDDLDVGDVVAATWLWDSTGVGNGTYRVDVQAATANGAHRTDAFTTFRVGGDPAAAPTPEASTPTKATPGFVVPLALAGLGLARRISR